MAKMWEKGWMKKGERENINKNREEKNFKFSFLSPSTITSPPHPTPLFLPQTGMRSKPHRVKLN